MEREVEGTVNKTVPVGEPRAAPVGRVLVEPWSQPGSARAVTVDSVRVSRSRGRCGRGVGGRWPSWYGRWGLCRRGLSGAESGTVR